MKVVKTATVVYLILLGFLLLAVAMHPIEEEKEEIEAVIVDATAPPDVTAILSALEENLGTYSSATENSSPPGPVTATLPCECAVFNTAIPTEYDQAIIARNITNVNCNNKEEQHEHCIKLCSDLARASKEHGPQLLCSVLGHYNNLKASVHSRMHGTAAWTYTGLTCPDICCHEHKVVDCKSQTENQPANQL